MKQSKRVYVESFVNSDGGIIESLKMLKIYQMSDWNVINIQKYESDMIDI